MQHSLNLIFSVLFLIIFSNRVFGFSDSTKLNGVEFSSDFEKNCFEHFINAQQFDTIGLLLSLNTKTSKNDVSKLHNELQVFIDRVNTEGGKKRKNFKKFADYLFEQVHAQFLKKYQENVTFDKIFSTGTYNCLTASALYALIFERMGIRYQIKETPSHVYIIAEPGSSAILIETTDPTGGYFAPDEKYKKQYVNDLIASKTVTATEVASEGLEATFEKHFYENESINLKQLVGLHYYNAGVALSELNAHKDASSIFEKGYIIYPCQRIGYSMRMAIVSDFEKKGQESFDKIENISLYLKLLKTDTSFHMQEAFVSDFEQLAERQIIQKDNPVYFEKAYILFQKSLKDTSLLKKIEEINWAFHGKAALLKGDFEKGGEYFAKAMQFNPSNVQYNGVVVGVFAKNIAKEIKSRKDIEDVQKQFVDFIEKYPHLAEHQSIVMMQGTLLVALTESAFAKGNITDGIPLLQKMEQYVKVHHLNLDPDYVASPYVKIVMHYINQKNYTEANVWIEKGLTACPECESIPNRLKALRDDIQLYHYELPEAERMKAIKRDAKMNKKN